MLGFVTGLISEARMLAGLPALVEVGGGTSAGANQAAERLIERGAGIIVSFGLAGGLDPALLPGALLVPETIVDDGAIFRCAPSLCAQFGGPTVPAMLGGGRLAATAAEKRDLFAATGAAAIDLESGSIARVAEAHGLKFGVLRSVADPAGRGLPPAALVALDARGRIVPGRILVSLCRHPLQIPRLVGLGREAAYARRSLVQALEHYRLRVSTTGT